MPDVPLTLEGPAGPVGALSGAARLAGLRVLAAGRLRPWDGSRRFVRLAGGEEAALDLEALAGLMGVVARRCHAADVAPDVG